MKEPYMKGVAAPSWPRVMRRRPVMAWRSVDRGKRRPGFELRNHGFGVPTLLDDGEGNTVCGDMQRVAHRPCGVRDPVHAWTLYAREPGDPASWPLRMASRGPRRESKEYDGDEQLREVGQPNSTGEAFEQVLQCAAVCGEGGGKGAGQGESVQ